MANRVKSLIESIHQGGSCPRLKIDLTREGVVCPDFVCEKWGEELIIDLDPSYPLNLAFTAVGVEADLSFGGYVTRCKFPYASIYLIVDRNTGKGELFEENIPESVRQKRQFTPAPRPSPARATTTPAAKKRTSSDSRRRRRRRPQEEETAAPAEAQQEVEETEAPKGPKGTKGPKIGLVAVEPEPEPEAEAEAAPAAESAPPTADTEPAAAPAQARDDDDDEDEDDDEDASADAERPSETEAQRRRSIFKVIDGGK